jgi:hypothetical protein
VARGGGGARQSCAGWRVAAHPGHQRALRRPARRAALSLAARRRSALPPRGGAAQKRGAKVRAPLPSCASHALRRSVGAVGPLGSAAPTVHHCGRGRHRAARPPAAADVAHGCALRPAPRCAC